MKVSLSRFVFFKQISTVLFAIVIAERMHALTQLLLFAIETYAIAIWNYYSPMVWVPPRPPTCLVLWEKSLHGHIGRQGRCTAAAFSHVGDDLCILGGAGVVVSAIPRGT